MKAATAETLIRENREKLDLIATSLLEVETLDGSQVEDIVKTGRWDLQPPQESSTADASDVSQTLPQSDTEKDGPELDPGFGASPATA